MPATRRFEVELLEPRLFLSAEGAAISEASDVTNVGSTPVLNLAHLVETANGESDVFPNISSLAVVEEGDPRPDELRAFAAPNSWQGDIPNGTVWAAGSVQRIVGDARVPAGSTLTIEPGVLVQFNAFAGIDLLIEGGLNARGTGTQPIVFTSIRDDSGLDGVLRTADDKDTSGDGPSSGNNGDWYNLTFSTSAGASVLEHVQVRFAGAGPGAAVIANSAVTISNSSIQASSSAGLRINSSNPIIQNTVFENGFDSAIRMDLASNPAMRSLTFRNNRANAVTVDAGTLPADAIWDDPDVVYQLSGDLVVPAGKTLTLSPGQIVKARAFAGDDIVVEGRMLADATPAQPIIFTSDRDDSAGGDTNNDGNGAANNGDWSSLQLKAQSTGNLLDNVQIRFAGAGSPAAVAAAGQLTLTNSTITRSSSAGLRITASNPTVADNRFENNVGPAISMDLASNPSITGSTLAGNGTNALVLDPGALPGNATWDDPSIVYRLNGDVTVPAGAVLTIAPGQVVKARAFVGEDLIVAGSLLANGTAALPIIFTSDRDDSAGGDTNNDGNGAANNGDWSSIQFEAQSTGNVLNHVQVRFAGAGSPAAVVTGGALTLTNSIISRSNSAGVRITASNPILTGNTFENNFGAAISMDLGSNPAINRVILDKNGANALALDAGILSGDAIWDDPDIVYRLSGDITVPAATKLTIAPGQVIKMRAFAGDDLIIDGTLLANATAALPIIFTSDRDDSAGGDTNNDGPSAGNNGDWNSLQFGPQSAASILNNAEVRFAGAGNPAAVLIASALNVTNSTISRSVSAGFRITASNPILARNTIENCFGPAISSDLASSPALSGNVLTKNAANALVLDAGTIPGDASWDNSDIVYRLSGDTVVPGGKTLTITPGLVIKARSFAGDDLIIEGTLKAEGTLAQPIIFTSDRDDSAGGDTNNDGLSGGNNGDWNSIQFMAASRNNSVSQAEIRYAGAGNTGAVWVRGGELRIDQTVVRQSSSNGVLGVDAGTIQLTRSSITQSGSGAIRAESGSIWTVLNNTFDQNVYGIVAAGQGRLEAVNNLILASRFDGILLDSGSSASFVNNTIVASGGVGVRLLRGNARFHNNIITQSGDASVRAENGVTLGDWRGNNLFNAPRTNYAGVADPGSANGNRSVDPLFVDPANGDYHLRSGSPLIDAGVGDAAPERDHDEVLRVDDPLVPNTGTGIPAFIDIGAFESNRWLSRIDSPVRSGQIVQGDTLRFSGTGQAAPGPTSFLWSLGDGRSSTLEDPGLVTFATLGEKEIRFTAISASGEADPAPAQLTLRVVSNSTPQPDLVVSEIRFPGGLQAGRTSEIEYSARNSGSVAIAAGWHDAVYLSRDSALDAADVLLSIAPVTRGLGPGEGYTGSAQVELDADTLGGGAFYIIVSVNDQWDRLETHRLNNELSLATDVAVPQLAPGVPLNARFTDSQTGQYYRVEVPPGQSLSVELNDANDSGVNELYLRHGALPTRGTYDLRATTGRGGDQSLLAPSAAPGTWYVLAYSAAVPDLGEYSITASVFSLKLSSVTPDHHGNSGLATLTLSGAGFIGTTAVELVDSTGKTYPATQFSADSFTQLSAQFNLAQVPPGVYSIRAARADGSSDELKNAFTVVAGGIAEFKANLVVPGSLGYHATAELLIQYSNTGTVAMPAPLLVLTITQSHSDGSVTTGAFLTLDPSRVAQGFWTSALPAGFGHAVQILASGATPGILQPGESMQVPVYYAGWQQPWDLSYPPFQFKLQVVKVDDPTPFNWNDLKRSLPQPGIDPGAWDAIWSNLQAQSGNTWGSFVSRLGQNAAYLAQIGHRIGDITQLFAFDIAQANGLSLVPELAKAVDARLSAPGLSLTFSRTFYSFIDARSSLGALGRGWYWTEGWDNRLVVQPDGTVVISGSNSIKSVFKPDSRGGYFADGDAGTLAAGAGATYTVREQTGILTGYRSDGKVDYVADLNGNRITASYTGALLTALVHSSGQTLQISYNAAGRIASLTDDAGRMTRYTYDANNEHLLTVTDFAGRTTSYTYDLGTSPLARHTLLSIAYPDGTRRSFSYDARGRLLETRLNDSEAIQFSYASVGAVTAENAVGGRATISFDHRGLISKVEDPLRRNTFYRYDDRANLTELVDAAGQKYVYTYDARGNLTRVTDPLGSSLHLAYGGSFGQLISLTDAKGNTTRYAYGAQGNLLSITYPNGAAETFTYDPLGNLTESINGRGQAVRYTYNARGLLTRKDFPDGSRVDYVYDSRGNPISATDSSGITLMQYDAADQITKITYPNSRFLQFTIDSAGRRSRSVDQDGFTVNYRYNDAGRLAALTDGAGGTIVEYTYDAAGRLTEKRLGNGTSTTYTYDAAGQMLRLVNLGADRTTVLSRFEYTYDALGRTSSMSTTEGITNYRYDALGQLTSVTMPGNRTIEYRYDAAGNRTSVTENGVTTHYTTNGMNQYTSAGAALFTYDADGNLIGKQEGASTSTYSYDAENRLVSMTGPAGTFTYDYNVFGLRAGTTHDGRQTAYLVDPSGLGNVVAEYSGSQLVARYTHGHGLISRVDPANAAAYYNFDRHGNASEITGTGGVVINRYSHSPFGQSLHLAGTLSNPFVHAGEFGIMMEGDHLQFMRERFYDSTLGRFTSPDPIGLAGGIYLYQYAGNNPIDQMDPSGLTILTGGATEISRELIKDVAAELSAMIYNATGKGFTRNAIYYGEHGIRVAIPQIVPAIERALAAGVDLKKILSIPGLRRIIGPEMVERIIVRNLGGGGKYLAKGVSSFARAGTAAAWGARAAALGVSLLELLAFEAGYQAGHWLVDDLSWKQAWDDWIFGHLPAGVQNFLAPDTPNAASHDPNDKTGPVGVGPQRFVDPASAFAYRIDFENDPKATAPAQFVTITDQLDADLDWESFQFTELAFGDHLISVPPNSQHYETVVPITVNSRQFEVQIVLDFDVTTGKLIARFSSIVPETGLPPDVLTGFLPPEDGSGRGMGHISYVIFAKSGLTHGTEILNQASIVFDVNPPILTPTTRHTIDARAPQLVAHTVNPGQRQRSTLSSIDLRFGEDSMINITPDAVVLRNESTGQTVPYPPNFNYDPATQTGTLHFSNLFLPNGNYRLTLRAAGIRDSAGLSPAADYTVDFHVLAGDVNGDRKTNDLDLYQVWQNLLKPLVSRNLEHDLNEDGQVTSADLDIVRQNYLLEVRPQLARPRLEVVKPAFQVLRPPGRLIL